MPMFVQLSCHQKKDLARAERIARNEARHEENFPSFRARVQKLRESLAEGKAVTEAVP